MRLLARLRSSAPAPAFSNVLTPGRIPEFCIPPRLSFPCAAEAPLPAGLPRRCAAEPDLWRSRAAYDRGEDRTDWDPRSQAALSLPHLPRARTAYGFCALLESPHTRRKESLVLRHPGALSAALPARAPPARDARRLPRAPDGLPSRALRVSRGRARARSASGGDEDERGSRPAAAPAPPSPSAGPPPERLRAEASVALGLAGDALRLAAEYCPRSARLRVRLLRAEGPAAALEPRAVGCRLSLVLRSPGRRRAAVLGRSRKAAFDQDLCFDGLTEEQLRRLAVRVKAESKGRGLERGRPLGQGELLLGSLLLL